MLELYHAPISTCSQKVRLVLAEKNLPWKGHTIVFANGDHVKRDYLKLNPNGVVPTLIDGGDPIIDSSVINEYLEDVYPQISVRPKDAKACARMRAWRQYIDEVPTPAIRPPSFNAYFVPIWAKMTDEQFEAYADRLPLRKHFYKKMGRTGFSEQDIAEALEKLRQTLERMERSLTLGPWLNGDDYTLADVSITPTIVRMEDLGLSSMWSDLPKVTDWYDRIRLRPNFDVAYMPGSRVLGPSC
ncbi:glutathione S-transferase family protein [Methylocella sp. CPCC 101449]|uniref:glutathione S-transferase family protein n=1 Tax=Methylocella sp. CPCC 101449 TaxID=2987531 RepID=UPI00288C817F|nr:glutathione S-transferase family protein [Methylocella sp. CPCC 101449]MDT2024289.1 glutathione S-transferase family protein [Methylocella sp. CPCC 101449]HEV2571200.1 glutathione S-transferase family protein [Beijerinckiaceae bacterium]